MTALRSVALAAALGIGIAVAGPLRPLLFDSNLHTVLPGRVYRSAQPPPARLEAWIGELSLRSVLNLRGDRPSDVRSWLGEERRIAGAHGVEHVSLGVSPEHMPSRRVLRELVQILDTAPRPLLVHCEAGAERSGLAAAVAVLLAGGDLAAARAQFDLRAGFLAPLHPEFPRVLDRYERWLSAQHAPSSAARFRAWVATAYVPDFYGARVEPVAPPAPLAVGAATTLAFRVTNTSGEPIPLRATPGRGVHLGAVLHPPDGAPRRELRGAAVERALAPGDSIELALPLPALAVPGHYRLEVDLVDEGVSWFHDRGTPGVELSLVAVAAR